MNSGATITFLIVSIGLKDADSRDLGEGTGYVNPRMKLTVIDGKGNRIDRSYSTAEHGTTKERQAILFDQELTIPLHLEDLYNLDAYIYFEFVHFKAHKARDSVKCYSFMSVRKMRNGCLKLPIFKSEKPTDMMRGCNTRNPATSVSTDSPARSRSLTALVALLNSTEEQQRVSPTIILCLM